MGPHSPSAHSETPGAEQIPPVEVVVTDVVARLSLAALGYLAEEQGKQADMESAEAAIDVAASAFERIKERLRPEERLAITQLLTETRMTFVRKRGL